MNLSRRGFFRLGAAAAVAATTNPVHFLAPVGGWQRTTSGLSIPVKLTLNSTFGKFGGLSEFQAALQQELYILLSKNPRIPYNEKGMDLIMQATEKVSARFAPQIHCYSVEVAHRECDNVLIRKVNC